MPDPSNPSERRNWHNLLRLFCASGFLAMMFLAVVYWAKRHDHPSATPLRIEGAIRYAGQPVHVILDCTCPPVLVERRTQTLRFRATLSGTFRVQPATAEAIDVAIDAGSAVVDPEAVYVGDGKDLTGTGQLSYNFPIKVTPPDDSLDSITFNFFSTASSVGDRHPLGSVSWGINSEVSSWTLLAPVLYGAVVFGALATLLVWADRRLVRAREKAERRLAEAKAQADANPGQARFAWDLAKAKLEAYFDRNLIQVNLVFWLAVFVMAVGFAFVLGGVVLSYQHPDQIKPALVAAISGIITQFIGATFMVIYRSTMAQANEFMSILERINNAGMAVQVLDSLPEGTDEKNAARAAISALLVGGKASVGPKKTQVKQPAAGAS